MDLQRYCLSLAHRLCNEKKLRNAYLAHMKFYIKVTSCVLILLLASCDKKGNDLNTTSTYLALGDSYTIGENVVDSLRWPVQLVQELNKLNFKLDNPTILAKTGWTTDELLSAMDSVTLERNYDYVSLLIGVNNQYLGRSVESFEPEFIELLNRAIGLAKNNKRNVFVVSIPDWGAMPFAHNRDRNKITTEINSYNNAIERICISQNISFFDVTAISRQALYKSSYVASDGLHPSGEMYAAWVQIILPFF